MHCSHRISGYIFIMHLPKFYTLPPTHVGNRGGFDKNSMSQHYFITQLVHRLFGKCWSYFSIAIYKKLRSFFVNNDRGSTNSSITGLNQPQPSTVYTLPRDTEYLQLLQVDQKAMHLIYLFRTQHVRLSMVCMCQLPLYSFNVQKLCIHHYVCYHFSVLPLNTNTYCSIIYLMFGAFCIG